MFSRKEWHAHETETSPAFAVGVLLLSIGLIVAYLVLATGVADDRRSGAKVYAPLTQERLSAPGRL
ncbi:MULTISPECIES: hypothetical protein [Sinorhizobium]|uniref:Uncharacterized protein n=2 Tax=Sinorhizobium TaxID=28105 RepID=A0A2S3YSC3_9HYPH|nr:MULTISPECIES: hypothetical protein [Sinorhizobium]AUX80082.1 hypothetical protein NXT3_PC00925 [Sinorhizobium fredii]PDT43529.1 hypothetical protein CO656_02260 [Sinorhizobium sp. FG01]PDT53077.1 hypothetical protein CO664_12145 [Sinorhizobium sp. NG07B]POH29243.1 hypothetical protein ATY30_16620 [Sinorhizobium americanum]POH34528.1 hypothetical protein ATY31_08775 [Sinorhizobium americanum]